MDLLAFNQDLNDLLVVLVIHEVRDYITDDVLTRVGSQMGKDFTLEVLEARLSAICLHPQDKFSKAERYIDNNDLEDDDEAPSAKLPKSRTAKASYKRKHGIQTEDCNSEAKLSNKAKMALGKVEKRGEDEVIDLISSDESEVEEVEMPKKKSTEGISLISSEEGEEDEGGDIGPT